MGWGGVLIVQVTRPGLHGWIQGAGREAFEAGNPAEQARLTRLE
jgi:hypothetical protein